MDFTNYKDVLKIIENMFKNNRLSHAYLLCGEQGTPKKDIAFYIAQKFYCNDACGNCPSCNQIINNIHPNIFYIKSEGQNIKKEQITNLIHELSRSSLVDGPRIYIIDNVEDMNKYSANSLLKFIEEPTNNIYAILTTSNFEAVLPTIKSRCQIINVKSNGLLDIDASNKDRALLSELTRSKEEALSLIESEEYNLITSIVEQIYYHPRNERISLIKDLYNIFREKANIELFIKISIIYLRDVAIYNHNAKPKVFEIKDNNIDAFKLIELLNKLQIKIRFNINNILALESFLLEGE